MIAKVAAGIYNYLPLGWRGLQKLQTIIREEMERAGSSELVMPAKARILFALAQLSPKLGDWILGKMTSS